MILRGHKRTIEISELVKRGIPANEIEFILDHQYIYKMSEQECLDVGCPAEGWADIFAPAMSIVEAWRHENRSWVLILCGSTGSGKTFAASWYAAMDNWVYNPKMQALGIHPKDINFQPCMISERELAMCTDEDRIQRYAECSFLAIDDVAAESEPLRGFMTDRITRILYRRYDASLPTLFTTNASVQVGDDQSILQRYGFRMASRLTAYGKSPIRWCGDTIDYRNDVHTQELRMSYEAWKEAALSREEQINVPQPEYASEETRERVNLMIDDLLKRIRFSSHNTP